MIYFQKKVYFNPLPAPIGAYYIDVPGKEATMQDKTFYVNYEQKYEQNTYCYAIELQAKSFADAERITEERYGNGLGGTLTITSIRGAK